MTTFRASTQYGDWNGDVRADDADTGGIQKYVRDKGLLQKGEFLIGIEFYQERSLYLKGYVINYADYDTVVAALAKLPDPLHLRQISLELTHDDFFKLFKRFSIALQPHKIEVIGREITTDE
jgi:hypothetical protein